MNPIWLAGLLLFATISRASSSSELILTREIHGESPGDGAYFLEFEGPAAEAVYAFLSENVGHARWAHSRQVLGKDSFWCQLDAHDQPVCGIGLAMTVPKLFQSLSSRKNPHPRGVGTIEVERDGEWLDTVIRGEFADSIMAPLLSSQEFEGQSDYACSPRLAACGFRISAEHPAAMAYLR